MTFLLALALTVAPKDYFKIQVIDQDTGRGVPLVELLTVNKIRFFTDSGGVVALNEFMGQRVFFHIHSDGYDFPKDSMGYNGQTVDVKPGGSAMIKLKRINIAERLCRLTGEGIYRDSALVGDRIPINSADPNGGVLGQDTAQAESYRGRMLWFWGDTDRASYPLGNFHTTGAFATLPDGKTTADFGLQFQYFTGKDGFVRAMVPSQRSHPIWVSGLTVLKSARDEELFAFYAEMEALGKPVETGYLKWNDAKEEFEVAQRFDAAIGWRHLDSHIIHVTEAGKENVEGNFPINVRVQADQADFLNPKSYEAFTCLDAGGKVSRNVKGAPDYRWQSLLPPITPEDERKLVDSGQLKPEEAHFLPHDSSGKLIFPHGGSIHWNAFRKKWIAVFTRLGGEDSLLGEIYYAEADAPTGPFKRAVKIFTHSHYTFYNPVQHEFLDRGKYVYIEGTYTAEFSGNDNPTPRYNYNQLLYRLDLSDPRMAFAELSTPSDH